MHSLDEALRNPVMILQRIEKGDLKCDIGAIFEVATIVGVKLFGAEQTTLTKYIRHTEDKLALLPKSIRKNKNGKR